MREKVECEECGKVVSRNNISQHRLHAHQGVKYKYQTRDRTVRCPFCDLAMPRSALKQHKAEMTILYWPKNIYPIFPKKDPQKLVLWDANNPNFLNKTLFCVLSGRKTPKFHKNLPQFQKLYAIIGLFIIYLFFIISDTG